MFGKQKEDGLFGAYIVKYHRLAHRPAESPADVHTTCTDAVPLSSFLSDFYISFRGVSDRSEAVPLDKVDDEPIYA